MTNEQGPEWRELSRGHESDARLGDVRLGRKVVRHFHPLSPECESFKLIPSMPGTALPRTPPSQEHHPPKNTTLPRTPPSQEHHHPKNTTIPRTPPSQEHYHPKNTTIPRAPSPPITTSTQKPQAAVVERFEYRRPPHQANTHASAEDQPCHPTRPALLSTKPTLNSPPPRICPPSHSRSS